MRFSRADGSYEDDIASGVNPRAASEVLDAGALEPVGALPVELRQCLSSGQSRGPQPPLDGMLGARGDFRIKQSAKECDRMLAVGERLACKPVALASHGREFEHARMRPDGGEHDIDVFGGAHAEHRAASRSES